MTLSLFLFIIAAFIFAILASIFAACMDIARTHGKPVSQLPVNPIVRPDRRLVFKADYRWLSGVIQRA